MRRRPRSANSNRIVAGLHACAEAFKVRPKAIQKIMLKKGWERSQELSEFAEKAKRHAIRIENVSEKQLADLCWGHQGVACEVAESPQLDENKLSEGGPKRVLLLDGIVDPQNLGAMLRTAWLMEVDAIYLPKDRAVGLTPTVCKVACGGAEHVPLVFANNFVSLLKSLKEQGFWSYSLAEKNSQNLYDTEFHDKVALVVGAEEKGIRGSVLKESDVALFIPQVKSGSSYNASVALGIALSEVVRPYKIRTN